MLPHKLCINVFLFFSWFPHTRTQVTCVASIHFSGAASVWGTQLLAHAKVLEFVAKVSEVRRLSYAGDGLAKLQSRWPLN